MSENVISVALVTLQVLDQKKLAFRVVWRQKRSMYLKVFGKPPTVFLFFVLPVGTTWHYVST